MYSSRETHRNELHLQSHEQHRLAKAERVDVGAGPTDGDGDLMDPEEKDTYAYEVNIPDLKPHRSVHVDDQDSFALHWYVGTYVVSAQPTREGCKK